MPDELARLALNGRATDSQFAQNPLPVARAMGLALAGHHNREVPDSLGPRTEEEVTAVREYLEAHGSLPYPFDRSPPGVITSMLDVAPEAGRPVFTHGAPIVDAAVLVDSVVTFESAGAEGFDPPERDLAIIIRSIAETFTSEVARPFLDGYEEGGGQLPKVQALDWYGLVAACR